MKAIKDTFEMWLAHLPNNVHKLSFKTQIVRQTAEIGVPRG